MTCDKCTFWKSLKVYDNSYGICDNEKVFNKTESYAMIFQCKFGCKFYEKKG
jgi:hypothetical protein